MKKSLLVLFILGLFSIGKLAAQTCLTSNLAAGKTVKASTLQTDAHNVTDGNLTTEWQPTVSGAQWIYVDLGQSYTVCKVILKWTTWASDDHWTIQLTSDTTSWGTSIYTNPGTATTQASGDAYSYHTADLSSSSAAGRYLRISFSNMTAWNARLDEIEVYNKVPLVLPTVSLTAPSDGANYIEGDSITFTATASEAGGTISKVEFYQGSTKIGEDATSPYSFTWTHVPEGEYLITAKATDASLGSSASTPINVYVDFPDPAWSRTGNKGIMDGNFLGTTDSTKLVFRTKNLKRMTILPNGNVGIGADTPTARLHTRGSVRMEGLTNDSTKNRVLVSDSVGNIAYKDYAAFAAAGNALQQGGNSFGATAVVGTKDNNSLDLYTNNLLRARLTNTGNLLLGTTTDNGKLLQVNGGLSVSGTSTIGGVTYSSNQYGSTVRTDSAKSILIGSSGASAAFYNNSPGSIIIHTPLGALGGIAGNISNSIFIGGNSAAITSTVSNSLVIARDMGFDPVYNGSLIRSNLLTVGGSRGFLRDDNTGGAAYMFGEFTGNMYLGYNTSNWIYTADVPTGYIQLGTTSHNLLALFGGFHAFPPGQSTLAGPSMRPQDLNKSFSSGQYFRIGAGRGTGTGIGSDLRLAVAPAGVVSGSSLNPYVDALTISGSTGYVGIGTTNPQSKLAVNGTITAKKIKVTQSGWPDYVFKRDYPLPGLAEVEKYIVRYKHLPGVESAKEITKKGLDLGANQAVLLKKIEELTLYLIQQDKTAEEQDAQMEKQQQEIEELKKAILNKN